MTAFEGSCGLVHEASCHILVCGGSKTQTMMQGYASAASSEAADPFFFPAVEPWGVSGTPPPRTVIGDPVTGVCGTGGPKPSGVVDEFPPFSVRDAGLCPGAPRHRARSATRR